MTRSKMERETIGFLKQRNEELEDALLLARATMRAHQMNFVTPKIMERIDAALADELLLTEEMEIKDER